MKKTKKSTRKAAVPAAVLFSKETKQQEQAIANLENLISSIYQDIPLAQVFSGISDDAQLTKIIAALNGTLDALPIENLTKGLFKNSKEDALFAKDFSAVLHGLKHLSVTVNKHFSDKK